MTVGEVLGLSANRTTRVGQPSSAVDDAVLAEPRDRSLKMPTLPTLPLLEQLQFDTALGGKQHRRLQTVDAEHG